MAEVSAQDLLRLQQQMQTADTAGTGAQPVSADQLASLGAQMRGPEETASASQAAPGEPTAPAAPQRSFTDKYLVPIGQGVGDIARTMAEVSNKLFGDTPIGRFGKFEQSIAQQAAYKASNAMGGNRLLTAIGDTIGESPQQENADYEANEAGNTVAPYLRMGGQAAVATGMIAGAPELAGELFPESAGTMLEGANNLLTKGGLVRRLVARSLQGSLMGGSAAAMMASASQEPWDTQIEHGMAAGAVLGPLGEPVARLAQKGAAWLGGLAESIYRAGARVGSEEAPAAENALTGAVAAGGTPQEGAQALQSAFEEQGVNPAALTEQARERLVQEAQKQASINGIADPKSLARIANAEQWGFHMTRGMAGRDSDQWANESALSKLSQGKRIQSIYEHNNFQAAKNFEALSNATGGAAETPYDAAESVLQAVTDKWRGTGKTVSSLYNQVRDELGGQTGLEGDQLFETLDNMEDNKFLEPLTRSVQSWLKKRGLIDEEGQMTGEALTVDQAENLRQWIGEELAGGSAREQLAAAKLQAAVDADVMNTTGSDAFAEARATARARFQEFREGGLLQGIISGKVKPDTMVDRYIVGKAGNLATAESLSNLKQSLLSGSPDQVAEGEQAWKDLQRQTIMWLQKQANADVEGGVSESTRAEVRQVRPAAFRRALAKIGPQKLEVLFGPEGAARLGSLGKAMESTMEPPALTPINYSNTAPVLTRLTQLAYEPIGWKTFANPIAGAFHLALKAGQKIADKGVVTRAVQPTAAADVAPQTNMLLRASAPAVGSAQVQRANQPETP